MDERTKGALQVLFALIVIAAIWYISADIEKLKELGYAGVFIISLLSSALIFIPAPGWAAVIAIGGVLNPYIVGVVAGIGSGLGEITGYSVGAGASNIVKKEMDGRFKKWKDWIRKNDFFAIFVLSAIPNPAFDVAGIAAGSLGIDWKRFLLACVIGRTMRYVLLAYLGTLALTYF